MTVRTLTPAITGGTPVREQLLPFARPMLGPAEEEAALRVIRSGWLTTGPESALFEQELAASLGLKEIVAVNSCTAALHLAVTVLRRPGTEVITTPFTFASSVSAIIYAGCVPVLVDVDPDDMTIDPERVRAAIGPRTSAVLAVDYAGQPARFGELRAAIGGRNISLIEDAAHSIGGAIAATAVGSLADLTCFSFYANKNITTGEGGALAALDERHAATARELRLHGMTADAWRRYLPGGTAHYDIAEMGFKYNLTDLAAAIGRVQLTREPAFRGARRLIAQTYQQEFAALEPLIRVPAERTGTTHAWHLYPIRLSAELATDRDGFALALRAEGISSSIHFTPVHRLSAYRRLQRVGSLANAEGAGQSELSLPIWPGMTQQDIADVVMAVSKLVRHFART